MFIMAPSYGARYLFTCPLGERVRPDPTRTGATCSGNETLACFEDGSRREKGSREKREVRPGGWGDSHMEQTGMLVGNFEFNP